MEHRKVVDMTRNVPTISQRLNFAATTTGSGGALRGKFAILMALPLLFMADLNGGLTNGGFTKSKMKEQIKAKPDYITNQVFVVHRQEMPSLD